MEIIIYGKDGCVNCDRARMLCQIQSIPFSYLSVGSDVSIEELQAKVGQPVRSLPQIFRQDQGAANASFSLIGGYDELRRQLAG